MSTSPATDKHRYLEQRLSVLEQRLQEQRAAHAAEIEKLQQRHAQELEALTCSTSWRVTAPLRILSRQILKIVNGARRLTPFKLRAISGLSRSASGRWSTLDNDPQFLVELPRYSVTQGWYAFKVNIPEAATKDYFQPILYVSYEQGFDRPDAIHMQQSDADFTCLIHFERIPSAIRLDVTETPGVEFSLTGIEIHRYSRARMAWKLGADIYQRERANGQSLFAIAKRMAAGIKRYGALHVARNLHAIPGLAPVESSSGVAYSQWIAQVEKTWLQQLDANQPTDIAPLEFVVLAIEADDETLSATLDSLLQQNLPDWKAWVVTSQPADSLNQYHDDFRFNFMTIAQDSTSMEVVRKLAQSQPEQLLTLIQAGVHLAPHYALALTAAPDADLIYFDHDSLTDTGQRKAPRFKPDWCPDYALEYPYIGPVLAVRSSLLNRASRHFSHECNDLHWQLLILLATNRLSAHIEHIPYMGWHVAEGWQYPFDESHRKVLASLLDSGAGIEAADNWPLSIRYPLPSPAPRIEIIIPTRDQLELLQSCISTLLDVTDYDNFHVTVVDNRSREAATRDYLRSLATNAKISVVSHDHEFNYSAINNRIALHSDADLLCFLNNDIEIIEADWLKIMVAQACRPEIGAVGAKLLYPDGNIQHGGVIVGFGGVAGHAFAHQSGDSAGPELRLATHQNYSAVTAACLVVKTSLFQELGGFNETQLAVAFNDSDLCLRLREKGLRNIWCPDARLIHHESASRPPETSRLSDFADEIRYMQLRWKDWIEHDPAYNPHLSLEDEPFQLSLRQKNARFTNGNAIDINPVQHPYAYESNEQRIAMLLHDNDKPLSINPPKAFTPGLSIVILTLEKPELIGPLLDDLSTARQQLADRLELQIIVGDTGSTSPEVEQIYARHADAITLVRNLRYHFSRCNNELFDQHVSHDVTLFLNNDIIFDDAAESLWKMYQSTREQMPNGVIGTHLVYPDGRLQHGGVSVIEEGELAGLCYHPNHGQAFQPPQHPSLERFPAVTGACLMLPSELFIRCGRFDENYAAEAQDIDLCFKATRLGGQCFMLYTGRIQHLENATRKKGEAHNRDRARFVRKWSLFYQAMIFPERNAV